MRPFDLSLYLVLNPDLCSPIGMVETTRLAVRGGATLVQLRDKHATTEQMIATGRLLKAVLSGTGVPLIVNDDVEAAIAIGADGVHVGQSDLAAVITRQRVGPDMIVGLSVETEDLARTIDPAIVDYAGVGPVFATATKADHEAPIGFDGLARIVAAAPVPTVAIGGLKTAHVRSVLAAGADGLAVVSAICGTASPEDAARTIHYEIRKARP
ncbi:thiamine phosphate synthase [Neorhizobium sp. NCHU2750]|uniref:thiamine phosphate synthase n=1 Tax=Neorhizobium sp. NCHU2750 TaxID=1825976 RepID=UPI000E76B626|nr:thiamine-phosphate pyrophosphorylase [Neorhizobium sp. NCHU2750]